MKFRWLVATAVYAAACMVSLFATWPDRVESGDGIRSDWRLLCEWAGGGDVVPALRLCWMIPVLSASAAVWFSARHGIRPAHAELAAALALGALAYPLVSFPEPGRLPRLVNSSAAGFVLVFAAVLGSRALALRRPDPAQPSRLC